MCGIAGWLGRSHDAALHAGRMALALKHRGPDAHGIRSWPEATLVHTRLSIIDLSPSGAQPMANRTGTVWTVFNGEIYNHREIRRHLENRGHLFRGRSDTEILPHLYEEEGLGFVKRLRGMFAVAIYDTQTRTLLLFRDRFGIKPLFYAAGSHRLAFASELRALLELPGIDAEPDRQSIYDFAALSYIPAPQTFYTGIRALEPGCWLEARLHEDGRVSTRTGRFHSWSIAVEPYEDSRRVVEKAESLLQQAVKRQLESDVPLGSLLSGGIDSSLVSCVAQAALGRLNTFNVRFSEAEYDETWAATSVARHIGSHHETLDIDDTRGTWEYITELLLHVGQPFADQSLFPVNAVCRAMRKRVAVALSGDGGDEGFGGYDTYWQIARILRFQQLSRRGWRPMSTMLGPLTSMGIVSRRMARRMDELNGADDTSIVQSLCRWIGPAEHDALCHDAADLLPVGRWFAPQWEHHLPAKSSRLERVSAYTTEIFTRLTMPNDFLVKVDMASMRESLEVRVPMLDEDLFSFGLSLPHSFKVRGRECKKVLRSVAARWLPAEVAAKPKRGFAIPVDTWATADFKKKCRETLLAPKNPLDEYLRPAAYRPVVQAFCEGRPFDGLSRQGTYQRVIMLLSLELNLERAASSASIVPADFRGQALGR
jgi:asparagine synthase (glutamine-hydrolysing)